MSQCVRNTFQGALGALIIFIFLLVAKAASAGIPCDCICERGKADNGIRVVMTGKDGCNIYKAIKLYPQINPATNTPYPDQVQFRSIFAANLEIKPDGTTVRHGVLNGCTKDGKPSPDADSGEKKACSHLAFYYVLEGIEVTIPSRRVFTPSEQAELDAAAAVAKKKAEKAAEQKKDEERRELAAEKRARELEEQLAAQRAETAARDSEIRGNQEIAWRAKFFTTAIAIIFLVSAWAFLMTLAASVFRFRLRPLTVDGYGYPDPLTAVRDLSMKLNAARTEAKEVQTKAEKSKSSSIDRIAELERQAESQRVNLSSAVTLAESIRKERDGYKSNLQALQKERGQGVEGLKAEIQRLQKQNEELLAAWNDADEARQQLEGLRLRQRNMLQEKSAEVIGVTSRLEKANARVSELETENELLRYTHGSFSANETDATMQANRLLSAIDEADEAVTRVRAPEAVRPPMKRRHTAPYPLRERNPEPVLDRPSSNVAPPPAGIESELAVYRQAFDLINSYLFWGGSRPTDEKLEDRVRRTVDAVSDACNCATAVRTQTNRPPVSTPGTVPPLSNSDIFRVAALMGVKDDFDLPGFQRNLLGASNANVAECLKTCIHEWARRGERSGDLVYAIDLPYEIYDLHAFLDSQLLCGADIAPLVPDGYADKLYQVKHAGEAVFNRRPRMSSFPPSAMPQTSG